MKKFNPDETYYVGDRVSYNDLCYECIFDNPDNASTPDKGIYWKETYAKLSDVIIRGYTESCDTNLLKTNTTEDIVITGQYFDSNIEVSIPTVTINSKIIKPNTITLNVTTSDVTGTQNIEISKNGVPNDGNQLTLEITDALTGSGPAGTFLTNFNNGGRGSKLWGPDWDLEIFGKVNSIDRYFVSSKSGTPSYRTGPKSGIDGYYAFCESSNPNNGNGQYGSATTSNFREIQSIDFDYFMYGSNMGDLSVQGFNGSTWTNLDVLSGQQQSSQSDKWLHKTIKCSNLTKIRFLFSSPKYATGYRADICVDNISIVSK